jgi:hypothetical protein
MYRCLPPWTIEQWLAGRTVLNFGVPAAEIDKRHHTEVYRLEKEIWQFWPHSLRLIAHEQLGFRNLFFGSVANLHYSGAKGF